MLGALTSSKQLQFPTRWQLCCKNARAQDKAANMRTMTIGAKEHTLVGSWCERAHTMHNSCRTKELPRQTRASRKKL